MFVKGGGWNRARCHGNAFNRQLDALVAGSSHSSASSTFVMLPGAWRLAACKK